jgi:hypothetical protein
MNEHPMSIEIRRLNDEIERLKDLLTLAGDELAHEAWSSEDECGSPSRLRDLIQKIRDAVKWQ